MALIACRFGVWNDCFEASGFGVVVGDAWSDPVLRFAGVYYLAFCPWQVPAGVAVVVWQERAVDSTGFGGYASGYQEFVVTEGVIPPPPAPTTLPVDTVSQYTLKLLWNTVNEAADYDVQYGTDSTFAAGPSTVEILSLTDTSLSIPRPTSATVYWRVRACNAGGCSGWTEGDSVIFVATQCITNLAVDVAADTTQVEQYEDYSMSATLAGNCDDPVSGAWWVIRGTDTTAYSFSYDSLYVSAVLNSPLLPTADTGVYRVQVFAVGNSDTVLADEVAYEVTAPPPLVPYQMTVTSSATALPGDGVSTATIQVTVRDSLGARVWADTGTSVDLQLTGSGLVDETPDTTIAGRVSFVYTAGSGIDTVWLVAVSDPLVRDSVRIILTADEFSRLKEHFVALMARLDTLRLHYIPGTPVLSSQYATDSLWSFYTNRIDIASPAVTDTAAFRRAILGLEAVLQYYHHPSYPWYDNDDDFTLTY
ncbi:hypothetical protein GF356_11610, partial [candidate division GN15 bacterium]|nr:hypothetical protein [candidate division GN15 bacterium]